MGTWKKRVTFFLYIAGILKTPDLSTGIINSYSQSPETIPLLAFSACRVVHAGKDKKYKKHDSYFAVIFVHCAIN